MLRRSTLKARPAAYLVYEVDHARHASSDEGPEEPYDLSTDSKVAEYKNGGGDGEGCDS